ncbi:unnamed protein product [Lathyrus sativus]|nr:unnamed protein product [Lathyrus sativus]
MTWIEEALLGLLCERSGSYQTLVRKLKKDGSRKCECLFLLRGCMLANKKWRFNVICSLHNYELCLKLAGYPNVCWLKLEEKEYISDMTLNLVQPKNILATLKRKQTDNISNIKQVYNIRYLTNKTIRGDMTEMQQL